MIFDIIKKRRSVFPAQYNDKPIERKTIEQLLEAANWAPTHKKTEPWRFKVVMGKKKVALGKFLSDKYQEIDSKPKQIKIRKLQENPARSGAVIAICMQRDPNKSLPEWEELAATAMAVQNMWLCCTEMGLGCYWSSPGLITHMDEFFDLNDGEKCFGFLYMGYYDDAIPPSNRTSIEDKVEWL
ncbi:nitroreductase [Flagellimonas sp. HMM57]|uniref:nitroreductase family protein n=1 Tax=unclassified Flagellimonas TaxID=2644544 RepID=UPI0013D66313|nr:MULTISPECIES: nitroreductase [unclassified Flagellimonas]UII77125.1 nitroreductase [Flagellimonas sp. HMM57]